MFQLKHFSVSSILHLCFRFKIDIKQLSAMFDGGFSNIISFCSQNSLIKYERQNAQER